MLYLLLLLLLLTLHSCQDGGIFCVSIPLVFEFLIIMFINVCMFTDYLKLIVIVLIVIISIIIIFIP